MQIKNNPLDKGLNFSIITKTLPNKQYSHFSVEQIRKKSNLEDLESIQKNQNQKIKKSRRLQRPHKWVSQQ